MPVDKSLHIVVFSPEKMSYVVVYTAGISKLKIYERYLPIGYHNIRIP